MVLSDGVVQPDSGLMRLRKSAQHRKSGPSQMFLKEVMLTPCKIQPPLFTILALLEKVMPYSRECDHGIRWLR